MYIKFGEIKLNNNLLWSLKETFNLINVPQHESTIDTKIIWIIKYVFVL